MSIAPPWAGEANGRDARRADHGGHLAADIGITLPVADGSVDAVIGVHTIYFWPDPAATLAEVARVLRPDGRLVLAFRSGEHPLPARLDPDVYRVPTTTQAIEWAQAAGFSHVRAETRPKITAVVWLTARML